MKKITYSVSANLNDTSASPIVENDQTIGQIQRVYSNGLKKIVDAYFDYRYFLIYEANVEDTQYRVKKIFRRGRLWFEGKYADSNVLTIISYENWRVGVPELFITHDDVKIKIEKEIEEPSRFYENENLVATWQASFDEERQIFEMELHIEQEASIQDPAFYVAISQATLFIGA